MRDSTKSRILQLASNAFVSMGCALRAVGVFLVLAVLGIVIDAVQHAMHLPVTDAEKAVEKQYSPITKEIESNLRLRLQHNLFSNGFVDGDSPRIELELENGSQHAITQFSLGYSLFSNGQKVYSTGLLSMPKWSSEILPGENATLSDSVEKSSDDYFKLKTSSKFELRFDGVHISEAVVDGVTVNFDKWTTSALPNATK